MRITSHIHAARLAVFIVVCVLMVAAFGGAVAEKVRQGNELYSLNKYTEALDAYNTALALSPENASIVFNTGAVLHQQKKYDQAIESFTKVIASAEGNELKEKAYYNMGNSLFMQGVDRGDVNKLAEAIESYKKALELNPDDQDAKYNLEITRKHLELRKDEDQEKKDQGSADEDKRDEKDEQDGGQDEGMSEMDKATPEKDMKPKAEQTPPMEGKISREEAEKLLKALEAEEKESIKEKYQSHSEPGFVGKDW